MLSFNLDTDNKSTIINLSLVGEDKPLEIIIGKYDIITIDNNTYIDIDNVSTSKLWMTILADELFNGKKIEISNNIAKILKVIA